jgi:flavin reductase (DIM6/NTAB) family NADH-FMN oxidoreductase RutF
MSKVRMGPRTLVYPMPAFLIGANVDDKPNFMTVAWSGIANGKPPMISIALQHPRHTLKGIKQNKTFSVNIPSTDMIKETDYCGIESGSQADKAAVCKFDVFYGILKNAPLIEQCPVNLECTFVNILDLGSHELVLGKIEEVYATENCLTNGKPDIEKIKPFIFSLDRGANYFSFGKRLASAFKIGKELKETT